MQVDFYQLAANPVEHVLPRIAERILAEGGRLLIVADDDALAARIDLRLWDYRADAFLPHGRVEEEGDAGQPILIAAAPDATNRARYVALADGLWRDAALSFDRVFHFFDGETIDAARAIWRTLGANGELMRNFWRQEGGKWINIG